MNHNSFIDGLLDGLSKAAGVPRGAREVEVEYEGKRHKPSPETLARIIGAGKGAKHTPIRGMLTRAKKWLSLGGRQRKFEALHSRIEGQLHRAKADAADLRDAMAAARMGRPFRQPVGESEVALPAVVQKIRQGYRPKDKAIPFASMGQTRINKLKARLERLGSPAKNLADYAIAGMKAKYKNEEPLAFKLDQAKMMRKGLLYAGAAALPVVGGAALYATLRRKKDKKGKR